MKKFWVGVVIIGLVFGGMLIWYKKLMYSPEKLAQMINTPTANKGMTEDYCLYQTALDPKVPDEKSIKITFQCGGKQALNTISWAAITDPTLDGLIKMVAGINGMIYPKLGLYCKVNEKISEDYSIQLKPGDVVFCMVPI